MKIVADDSIPIIKEYFPPPFQLERIPFNQLAKSLNDADILICRSTLKVNRQLLEKSRIKLVASATSGTDHIDTAYLEQKKIQLIDAKGANASAVADYILAVTAALNFNPFDKTIGIIGLGQVGSQVWQRFSALQATILINDPIKAISSNIKSVDLNELKTCDLVTIHTPLTKTSPHPSYHLLDAKFLKNLKPGAILINAARGGVVDERALIKYGQHLIYCADVYENEPLIEKAIINACQIATPHIAGHSIEAKLLAPIYLSRKIHDVYQLKMPNPSHSLTNNQIKVSSSIDWQSLVLSLYDPRHESLLLKSSPDNESLQRAFNELRQKHKTRHGFNTHQIIDKQSNELLTTFDAILGRSQFSM